MKIINMSSNTLNILTEWERMIDALVGMKIFEKEKTDASQKPSMFLVQAIESIAKHKLSTANWKSLRQSCHRFDGDKLSDLKYSASLSRKREKKMYECRLFFFQCRLLFKVSFLIFCFSISPFFGNFSMEVPQN
jgi:hypothetical protein